MSDLKHRVIHAVIGADDEKMIVFETFAQPSEIKTILLGYTHGQPPDPPPHGP